MQQVKEYSQFKVGLTIDLTRTPYGELNNLTLAMTKLYDGWNGVQDALGGVIPPIHLMFKEVHEYTCSMFWDTLYHCYNIPVNDRTTHEFNLDHNVLEGTLKVVKLPNNHGIKSTMTLEELRSHKELINGGDGIVYN